MQIKIIDFNFRDEEHFAYALEIRTKVFVKEQNVPEELEYDGFDPEAVHFLLYVDSKPVATSRYRITAEGYKLERFAVLEEFRNKGIGKILLEFVIDKIPDKKTIYCNSQTTAANFYKNNGFEIVGDAFYEAGIEHYRMIFVGE